MKKGKTRWKISTPLSFLLLFLPFQLRRAAPQKLGGGPPKHHTPRRRSGLRAAPQRHHDTVCKLKKALYGLRQAAKAWYEEISRLINKGFPGAGAGAGTGTGRGAPCRAAAAGAAGAPVPRLHAQVNAAAVALVGCR